MKETVKALARRSRQGGRDRRVDHRRGDASVPGRGGRKAGIPLVAFNVDSGSSARRFAYVGENPRASGVARRRGDRAARAAQRRRSCSRPEKAKAWIERRLEGVIAGLARASKAPAATVVRLSGDGARSSRRRSRRPSGGTSVRGLFAVDGTGTLAADG